MHITCSIWSFSLATISYVAMTKSSSTFLNFRLPNETYPEHYDIKLTTNIHIGKRTFLGEVIIDIVVEQDTSSIVLHSRLIKITKVTIASLPSGKLEDLYHEYEVEREFLTLRRKFYQQFTADTKWKLYISYSGELLTGNKGFFLSKYFNDMYHIRFLAATHFESTNARHAFPCYDEPNIRAKFTITISHSPTYTAISNMPVNDALSSAGTTVFLTTPPISTYVVAFVVSDFQHTKAVSNGLIVRVYSRPSGASEHGCALASSVAVEEYLSKFYVMKTMLPHINHVAVPKFSPQITQNWGLVLYRETKLLCNIDTSNVFRKMSIAKAIAHGISHQWFCHYVTIKWWNYLWLKEGFAILFSYQALDNSNPEWDVWQEFYSKHYQNALDTDETYSSRPMTSYVQTPEEIENLYDPVSSSKASSVLLMWNNALTENCFRKGLRNFITKTQYNTADEEDFFIAMQTAVATKKIEIPATIKEMMSTWTNQGGYPLLMVIRNYEDGTFTVKQMAYNNDEAFQDARTWYVPINYAVESNPDFRDTKATHYLLKACEMKINDDKIANKDWLILNKQSTGFYRINYDAQNWNLIAEGLVKTPFMIHYRNRAQLMNDAFHLTTTNRLNHAVLLKMLKYLKKEGQYAPWLTAYKIFGEYNRYLSGATEYPEFKLYVAELVYPIYQWLGVNDVPSEPLYNCLEETNSKLKAFIKKKKPIEQNLIASIYCNGLRQSGDEEFTFLYRKLMTSTSQLISCLSCSENITHIKKFIYSSVEESNGLRSETRSSLLRSVYPQGESQLLACIEFLNEKWNAYGYLRSSNRNSNPLDSDIRGMASHIVNKKQEEQLLALVDKIKHSPHVNASLEKDVKKKIAHNFQWLKFNGKPILSWIAQHGASKL